MASGANVVEILVKSTNATGAGFAEAAAGADELAAKTQAAMSEYEAAMAKAAEEQARLDELQRSGAASADELAAAQDRVTQATLRSLDAQLQLGRAELEESARAREAATAQEDLGAKTEAAGAKQKATAAESSGFWGKASMAILGVGAAMIYGTVQAAKFQSVMETLHTQAGVAQSQIKSLGDGVLALAGQVGDSPTSLAHALYHIESSFASVGITGPKALDLLKTAAQGAAVGHADLVDVTNALDATIASGVPGIKSFSGAMGELNAIVGSGDMTMQDLADAMGTGVMAVAKSYGQSITEVGAALATFGDNNIRGAKAATDLRMAWQAVQAPMKTGAGTLKSLGLTMTSLADTMTHHGMTAAIQEFVDHLKASKVPASEWGQMVTEIFGKKAGVGIGVMVDQLDRLKSKFPDLKNGASGFGDAWKKQQETVSQQWKDLTQGAQALATSMGAVFLPMAMEAVRVLTSLANWLNQNRAAAYALAAVISGGLAMVIGGKMINALREGAAAFKMLGESETLMAAASKVAAAAQWLLNTAIMDNPIGLIIVAIIALVAGLIYAYTHFKTFRDIVNDVGRFLKTVFLSALHSVENGLTDMANFATNTWHVIQAVTTAVWGAIRAVISGNVSAIRGVLSWFGSLPGLFRGWWNSAVSAVNSAEGSMLGVVRGIPGHILGALGDLGGLLFGAGQRVIQGLISGIGSMIGSVGSAIGSIASEITSHLPFSPAKKGPLSGAGAPEKAGQRIAQLLGQGMTSGLPSVTAAASRLAGGAAIGGHGAAGGAGGAQRLQLEFVGSPTDPLLLWLRNSIRVRGGNVQQVLGH